MIDRVGDRASFVALRTHGVRIRRGPLSLSFLDDGGTGTRLAFAIPRRTGGAVVRNRIRRRLRAIMVDLEREQPDLVPRGTILIGAGPDAARRSSHELRHDVIRLLDDLHIRRQATS